MNKQTITFVERRWGPAGAVNNRTELRNKMRGRFVHIDGRQATKADALVAYAKGCLASHGEVVSAPQVPAMYLYLR